jgi:hypothetical protein
MPWQRTPPFAAREQPWPNHAAFGGLEKVKILTNNAAVKVLNQQVADLKAFLLSSRR